MIGRAALRGLILEEALARLLRDNGYSLLVSAEQDDDALTEGHNGLQVRGRGADHQVDALGDLLTPTPFGLPVRLFVEAKFRSKAIGLPETRNAHGVINDVNEHFATGQERGSPLRRHDYRYSLFSTRGFTVPAQEYSLAHQISLVDLSGPAFRRLRSAVENAANGLLEAAAEEGLRTMATTPIRTALRVVLGTWTADSNSLDVDPAESYSAAESRVLQAWLENPTLGLAAGLPFESLSRIAVNLATELDDSLLLLGFPPAPFILALQPDDLASFDDYVAGHGSEIPVDISLDKRGRTAGEWSIEPADGSRQFTLSFGVPRILQTWLLADDSPDSWRVRTVKEQLLKTITVFRKGRAVRLELQAGANASWDAAGKASMAGADGAVAGYGGPALEPILTEGRSELGPEPVEPLDDGIEEPWTQEGARELIRRLEDEGPVQADVIRFAVQHRGTISRQDLYRVANYEEDRSLKGFTRPINRIVRQLLRERLIGRRVAPALITVYEKGHVVGFRVPDSLADILRNS